MKNYHDFIVDYLKELKEDELMDLWNEYCRYSCIEDEIYYNDDYFLNEMFINTAEAVRAVCYGDYRYMDTYVIFNAYANLESFNRESLKDHIYMHDLASYLEDNKFLEDEYFDYVEDAYFDYIEENREA